MIYKGPVGQESTSLVRPKKSRAHETKSQPVTKVPQSLLTRWTEFYGIVYGKSIVVLRLKVKRKAMQSKVKYQ